MWNRPRGSGTKHGNKKIVDTDGQKFDSIRECGIYHDLCNLQAVGKIKDLKRQVPFVLAPSVKFAGDARAKPSLKFTSDFTYIENNIFIVADAKSPHLRKETAYRIRKHLMKSVHGLDILEL